MSLKVNDAGLKHAKKLIEEGKIDSNSPWNKGGQLSAQEGDQYIQQNGWDHYGQWFLAVESNSKKDEKMHYEFPFGDFRKIYREGIIAVKKRAAQYHHHDIEAAADQLLALIEKKETVKHK